MTESNSTNIVGNSTASPNAAFVAIQLLIIIPGLVLYVVVIVGLIATYIDKKITFYLVMTSLAFVDIGYLCETLLYTIPCVLLHRAIYGEVGERIMGHFDTVTWFLQCSHVMFISINRLRFVSGTSLQSFDKVYSFLKTMFWITLIYVFSLSMSGLMNAFSCFKFFEFDGFYWTFDCTGDMKTNVGMLLNNIVSGLFCLLSGLLYTITWTIVKFKKQSNVAAENQQRYNKQRISAELSLMIQFSAVTASLVLNYLGFWIIPNVLPSRSSTMLIQLFAVINASINPYIYLAFNKTLKLRLKRIFCRTTHVESSIVCNIN